jgi:hypothetical protein
MKVNRIVSPTALVCVLVVGAAILAQSGLGGDAKSDASKQKAPAEAPARQVIACYFHRTVRCPTCQKISAYIEESLKTRFAKEMKDDRVVWKMIDFQDPKNQKLTAAYKIEGPTLVLMDLRKGKVTAWKPLPKVWLHVADKDAFFKYVQDEVRASLEKK